MLKLEVVQLLDEKGGVNSTKIRKDPTVKSLIDRLIARTSYLPDTAVIGERIYQTLNDMTARPLCIICANQVKLKVITHGYSKYCSAACSYAGAKLRAPKIKAAIAAISQEQRSVSNEQRKATTLAKYGVCSVLADKPKMRAAMLAKHGVDNASKLKAVHDQRAITSLARYGVTHFCKLDAHKEQIALNHRKQKLEAFTRTMARATMLGYKIEQADKHYIEGSLATVIHSCGSIRQLKLRSDSLPSCHLCLGKNASQGEHLIRQLLINIMPNIEVRYHDRTVLAPFEMDFYLPELKLGIEFHGSYWHSAEIVRSTLHQEKALLAKERGIKLIQVLDESQLSALLARLTHLSSRKLHARQLIAKRISIEDAAEFCSLWHRQGSINGAVSAYGLYEHEELVSTMIFGKPRFTGGPQFELLRACSSVNVRGGAGKLFALFVKEHAPKHVISYADLLWGYGDTYIRLGFKQTAITAPGYLWVSKERVLTRYATQKHKLAKLLGSKFEPAHTEAENMSSAGYFKVYDAGNVRYDWLS